MGTSLTLLPAMLILQGRRRSIEVRQGSSFARNQGGQVMECFSTVPLGHEIVEEQSRTVSLFFHPSHTRHLSRALKPVGFKWNTTAR